MEKRRDGRCSSPFLLQRRKTHTPPPRKQGTVFFITTSTPRTTTTTTGAEQAHYERGICGPLWVCVCVWVRAAWSAPSTDSRSSHSQGRLGSGGVGCGVRWHWVAIKQSPIDVISSLARLAFSGGGGGGTISSLPAVPPTTT